ncbi:MAG: hypothetical protein OXR66_07815 [Candidatus Woesearchaeota archaeon]|nr:hypothetical protein [Candidatus Woesearchaeota archaeon]
MPSITKKVWEILDNDITIKKDLERGIINVSALSQYLLDEHDITGSLDSVISAVRRYKANDAIKDSFAEIQTALNNAIISTKTNVAALTLKNTQHTFQCLSRFMAEDEFIKTEEFRLLKYKHNVFLVVGMETLNRAEKFFSESIVEQQEAVVELIITLMDESWKTRGILSRVTNELSGKGVNVEMAFTIPPAIHIFVKQEGLVKAHEAIMRISGR